MTIKGTGAWRLAALSAITMLVTSAPSFAQAWVAPKGEAEASLTWQFASLIGHLNDQGGKENENGSQSHALTFQLDYSLTDRFAVSASLPYIATRLASNSNFRVVRTGIDDGRYHSTWQDYRFDLRYNVLTRPLALTPFVSFVLPSHHYATLAEVAIGRDLRETHVGLNAGRLLAPLLPNAYIESRASYVFSQKVAFTNRSVSTNRFRVDSSLGSFLTPRFSARVIANYQKTFGGLTGAELMTPDVDPFVLRGHDRLLREGYFRLGLGAGFSVTPKVDVYAAYVTTIKGRDSHYGHGIAFGVSRTFPGPGSPASGND